jgi:hypothetical protein
MTEGEDMHPFRAAVEAGRFDALEQLLAEDVRFLSPVAFTPYDGRALVGAILRGVGRVFEDFVYVREVGAVADPGLVLMFTARLGEREVHGADFLQFDDAGLIRELCVMLRPGHVSTTLDNQPYVNLVAKWG